MKKYKITLIPGDGIGPEITEVTKRCIEATGVKIEWEQCEAGIPAIEKFNDPLPRETIESIRKNKICLKGPITTPVGTGYRSINVALRQIFNLYACVRPFKVYQGARTFYKDIDLVIIRENMEDLYAGIEFEIGKPETLEVLETITRLSKKEISRDSGISIKPISISGSEKIVRFAFEYARKNKRKKVTAIHKANIMKFTDGLFLDVSRKIAADYSDVEFEDRIVDNMAMQLVQKPQKYDILVCPNLYGDILSDLCAGLVGGLGLSPGANYGDDVAIFEPTHGSAPKYAGKNVVNPSAQILAAVLMLRYIEENIAATKLEEALAWVIKDGKYTTYDFMPEGTSGKSTTEMGEAIIKRMVS
ncbi:MAG TPA: isocitrate/isopropylmalate dehydrogenase family protein [Candidatus Ratteibacteria bacterium]|nr:isocitrate/isopropylmalate dehydrogenase family protein [bacterium]HQL64935.1 isocitrate/isopropylmalate dehydrogenase family protein [bacterium]HRS07048.1 isocitrate/isopropylmalate dehydrogenase family protein [Candidatus Ratteibacteria bacterium]HRV03783.1 isocitrate/isopropylmalate dehydrogenase family protein [Candidatus Ratteibacteria bacterium]